MKNIIIIFIVFILVLALAGCDSEDMPEGGTSELEPEISEPAEDKPEVNEVYEYLKSKTGYELYLEFLEGGYFGGFFDNTWNSPTDFHPDAFTFFYESTEISRIVMEDNEAGKEVPEVMEIPQEQVEDHITSFFDITADYLRGAQNYNPEDKIYAFNTLGGFGGGPGYNVYEVEDLGGDLYLFRCDCGEENPAKIDITLEIKELGTYRYVACKFDNGIEGEPVDTFTAEFTLGLKGEVQTLSAGDTIGDWTLEDLEIQLNEDTGEVFRAEGDFVGSVVLEGKITRSVLLEKGYDFTINDSETEKLPHYISLDGQEDRRVFTVRNSEEIENMPTLDFGEEVKVKITVSKYHFVFAYMMAPDYVIVSAVEILE